jgi:hypothetical protein
MGCVKWVSIEVKKKTPIRTRRQMADGGKRKGKILEMSNLLTSRIYLCKPDAMKKPHQPESTWLMGG